ncbi:type II secretion system F family protein [Saccharopolyspora indica]|uniref:type II secretion system F family protein n=1 Tax=Saccharopolyspora indica TaxID=1229659 RepID=UPI0022EB96D0|nr:type II secretion system F family protein [Saccharopolyspora indica]MDA3648669.1 type II secretion system F family protein [Saccharopolyspora indica]
MIEAVPVLAAAAVLAAPTGSGRHRLRSLRPRSRSRQRIPVTAWALPLAVGSVAVQVFGLVMGVLIGLAAALAARRWSALMARRQERTDPLVLAAGWDLLAAGMRAGLPVPVVVRAVAEELAGSARRTLREVAAHLALGSDAVTSWEPALADQDTAELARAARRTARTGQGLAEVAAELAEHARATVAEQAEARAQRAAVWISAPLGLCFLPAFLCLGVVPVVAGTLNRLAISG